MRILHSMLRVKSLDASVAFYKQVLNMQMLRQNTFPEGRFTLTFMGYQPEAEGTAVELTHNWDNDVYQHGDYFGHIAIEVDDIYAICQRCKDLGYQVIRDAGPMAHGRTVIAFVTDPDGHQIELIQKGTWLNEDDSVSA
ncbi:MAG: lactoylglutathione lyase [Plesiomonas sp.]|uniref:lactoylglutathione lyase n=1 Tax=Plesiomonas sp. TaxID=2486279 RepID=UPI003EE56AAC